MQSGIIGAKQPRKISAADAAAIVRSGDWVDYGVTLCQPDVFDKALAARKSELRNVKIRSCISMKSRAVLEADPGGEHFFWFSWHFSGYDRKKHDAGITGEHTSPKRTARKGCSAFQPSKSCVYRKPKSDHSGDAVRPGRRVNE
jgi:acyl-CoA hydrolase